MIRKINLILQGKGGTGKSLYTYLRALSEMASSSLFVDADGFAKTSSTQLIFYRKNAERRCPFRQQDRVQVKLILLLLFKV